MKACHLSQLAGRSKNLLHVFRRLVSQQCRNIRKLFEQIAANKIRQLPDGDGLHWVNLLRESPLNESMQPFVFKHRVSRSEKNSLRGQNAMQYVRVMRTNEAAKTLVINR